MASFDVSVGVRGVVFCDMDGNRYKTGSCDTVKNMTVRSDISVKDLRKRITEILDANSIPCDHTLGKLFYAPTSNSKAMKYVKDKLELEVALAKGKVKSKIVHMSVGARPDDFDAFDVLGEGVDSQGNPVGFRDPPVWEEAKPVRAAAKENTQTAARIRQFVEALYHNADSPFYHGFSSYHSAIIQERIKKGMDNKEAGLITDTVKGEYPAANEWSKYSPEGNWSTEAHNRGSMGIIMERGKFPPKSGMIPTPFQCKQQAEQQAASGTAQTAGSGTGSAGGTTFAERIITQMAASNMLAMQRTGVMGPGAGDGAAGMEGVSKKRKLQDMWSQSMKERKEAVAAGYADGSEFLVVIDRRAAKIRKRLDDLAEEEEAELFA